MLKKIWINPPIAFARVGASTTPCSAFSWSDAEISPEMPAMTTLQVEETLEIAADGTITSSIPNEVILKDNEGFRPVCPFFELWGEWEKDGTTSKGQITEAVLQDLGLGLADVAWAVELGNLKPYHITLREQDKIAARTEMTAAETTRHPVFGKSPPGDDTLVTHTDGIPMGEAQPAKPNASFEGLRLRFYPPKGILYGPPDIKERIEAVITANPTTTSFNARWRNLEMPTDRQRINSDSGWATHNFLKTNVPPLGPGDGRLNPGGLVASLTLAVNADGNSVETQSIGIVDDVGDGVVSCTIAGLTARASLAVGPPDFAPANRPVVSLQDGLSDRELRAEVRGDVPADDDLEAIVADIFERALETSELMNKDAQNYRARGVNNREYLQDQQLPNPSPDFEADPFATLWPIWTEPTPAAGPQPIDPGNVDAMPVTFLGQRKHRRYNAVEYLRDRLKEEPELIEKWLRPPRPPFPFYDRRMPALMRGSDRHAMHLTRRQYELIQIWAKKQAGL